MQFFQIKHNRIYFQVTSLFSIADFIARNPFQSHIIVLLQHDMIFELLRKECVYDQKHCSERVYIYISYHMAHFWPIIQFSIFLISIVETCNVSLCLVFFWQNLRHLLPISQLWIPDFLPVIFCNLSSHDQFLLVISIEKLDWRSRQLLRHRPSDLGKEVAAMPKQSSCHWLASSSSARELSASGARVWVDVEEQTHFL